MRRGSDDEGEEEDDIHDEADRGFLTHAHGSLLASNLSGGGRLESTSSSSSGAGGKVIVHLGAYTCSRRGLAGTICSRTWSASYRSHSRVSLCRMSATHLCFSLSSSECATVSYDLT